MDAQIFDEETGSSFKSRYPMEDDQNLLSNLFLPVLPWCTACFLKLTIYIFWHKSVSNDFMERMEYGSIANGSQNDSIIYDSFLITKLAC